MRLDTLKPFPEERKNRKRIGRGSATGQGCTAGKGNKGQNARAGGGVRPGFEGGQMPLQRRLPKHGFKNFLFKTTYEVISVGRLAEAFPDKTEIKLEDIYTRGLCKKNSPVKILSDGELSKALTVEAHKFSKGAVAKIEKAGGKINELSASAK